MVAAQKSVENYCVGADFTKYPENDTGDRPPGMPLFQLARQRDFAALKLDS